MPAEENVVSVTLKANGDITQKIEGADVVIAHFSRTSGHLEFETETASKKLYSQTVSAIGTLDKGTRSSGLVIKTISVKGKPVDAPAKNIPAKPKRDPMLGDTTPALVEWYFKYKPQEAYVRYGVFVDEIGVPVRKDVRRRALSTVDKREMADEDIPAVKDGNNSVVKGSVVQEVEVTSMKNQIIARRATCLTFTPNEVIGGFSPGEDEDEENQDEGGSDE